MFRTRTKLVCQVGAQFRLHDEWDILPDGILVELAHVVRPDEINDRNGHIIAQVHDVHHHLDLLVLENVVQRLGEGSVVLISNDTVFIQFHFVAHRRFAHIQIKIL